MTEEIPPKKPSGADETVSSGPGSGSPRPARWLTGGRGRPAAGLILLAMAAAFFFSGPEAWRPIRSAVFDAYQRRFPRTVDRLPVVIVDIDEASLKALGRWPWPRTRLAELVEAAARLGAEAVGFDIIMPEPDSLSPEVVLAGRPEVAPEIRAALAELPSNDQILARTLRRTPSVVARAALIQGGRPATPETRQTPAMVVGPSRPAATAYQAHLANIPVIEEAAFGCGYLNDTRDPDGVVRSMPLVLAVGEKLAPSLSLELLRTALGANWYSVHTDRRGVRGVQIGEAFFPADADGRIRLHYSPARAARRVSALSLLRGAVEAGAFDRQVAIIGVTAVGAIDVAATPAAARMDGVEIQAQMVENLLAGSRLIRPAHARELEAGVLLFFGLVLILLVPRLHPGAGVAVYAAVSAAVGGASLASFLRARLLLDPSLSVLGGSMVLVVLLCAGFAEARRRQKELDAALESEKLERMRIAGELAAAREIQMGMLPAPGAIERLSAGLDFFARLEPAEEVGGDLYDAFMIDDRHFFFMVGDVAGKGVAASLFMALSKTLTQSTAMKGLAPIDRLFSRVNDEISRQNPAMLFVTAVAGVVDVADGRIQLCCAGHEAPILLRPGRAPATVFIEAGPPLCVLENYRYTALEMMLQPGDLLVMISDGITEAQNDAGELFGRDRVLDALDNGASSDRNAEGICRSILEQVKNFADGAAQSDDITVMAVGFRAGTGKEEMKK